MRSYVVARIALGLGLCASPALADDKLGNPTAPADAPVAAPSAPAPSAPASSAPGATAPASSAPGATPSANTPSSPAPIAKAEAKPDPLADLPKQCAPIAKRMALPNKVQAMSARIALASCMADARIAPLKLLDTQESMLDVETAIAPSFELLDDVIARGDVQNQLLAHHAKMKIVQQGATRMLASVPPAAQPTVEAAQLRDSRRALVEAMIEPWRAQIADEARAANAIARANPKLEKNAVVALALRDTKKVTPEVIATREAPRPSTPTREAARSTSAGETPRSSTPARDERPAAGPVRDDGSIRESGPVRDDRPSAAGTAEGTLR